MKITGFKYLPFELKLQAPFKNSHMTFEKRCGYYLIIKDESGRESIGECSPLPGLSSETITDVQLQLPSIGPDIVGREIGSELDSINSVIAPYSGIPSIKFALEQALLNSLFGQSDFIIGDPILIQHSEIKVNTVFGLDEPSSLINKIENKFKEGFRTFKLKIGREDFKEDLSLIEDVFQSYGDTIRIRIDANRKWGFEESSRNLDELSRFNIEFIEEPCARFEDLLKIAKGSPVPIAADESIKSDELFNEIIYKSNIKFLIIKPTIYGGIFGTARLIKLAEAQNKKIIISSAFESNVGKSALVLLASMVTHFFAHGLDTAAFFEKNTLDHFKIQNGLILITSSMFPITSDPGSLCLQ